MKVTQPARSPTSWRVRQAALAMALVLLSSVCCSSCIDTPAPPAAAPAPTPTVMATAAVPSPLLQAGQAPYPPATQYAEPVWNEAAENAARGVAMLAMEDFARVDRDAEAWSNALARWLTPQAASDFVGTDPAEVPVKQISGAPELIIDPENGFGVIAVVPTDAGEYTVRLLRPSGDHPWKVTRIAPRW